MNYSNINNTELRTIQPKLELTKSFDLEELELKAILSDHWVDRRQSLSSKPDNLMLSDKFHVWKSSMINLSETVVGHFLFPSSRASVLRRSNEILAIYGKSPLDMASPPRCVDAIESKAVSGLIQPLKLKSCGGRGLLHPQSTIGWVFWTHHSIPL